MRLFRLCLLLLTTAALRLTAADEEGVQELVKDTTSFGAALYNSLNDTNGGNLLFSPYSLHTCLSMVYEGARDETAGEMEKALSLYLKPPFLSKASAQLAKTLQTKSKSASTYQLNIANGLWVDQDTFLLADFRHVIGDLYKANLQAIDFTKSDAAIEAINEWTSNQTQGKIPRLFTKDDITPNTRMVLTNAIYFKGSWVKPFDPKKSQTGSFTVREGCSVDTKMMHQTAPFLYFENNDAQFLVMTFQGRGAQNSRLACMIALPKTEAPLGDLEKSLSPASLHQWLSELHQELVHVQLPSFTVRQRYDLNQTLIGMGMPKAFTKEADFSGIDGMRDLFLSKVVHEAFFALDEAGVTAAAATGASMNVTAVPQTKPPIEFIADRPFLYFIVDLNTETLLFLGKLQQPSPTACN